MNNFSPKKIHNILGKLSCIDVFWEAKYKNTHVYQVSDDGMIARQRKSLPVNDIEYWGVVCKNGRYGFDLKHKKIILNNKKINFKFDNEMANLQYRRSVILSSDGEETTQWVKFGFENIEMEIIFYPHFKINLLQAEKK